jgi:hypothetical protein
VRAEEPVGEANPVSALFKVEAEELPDEPPVTGETAAPMIPEKLLPALDNTPWVLLFLLSMTATIARPMMLAANAAMFCPIPFMLTPK